MRDCEGREGKNEGLRFAVCGFVVFALLLFYIDTLPYLTIVLYAGLPATMGLSAIAWFPSSLYLRGKVRLVH